MRRERKELNKKIDQLQEYVAGDDKLGCGFAPAGFYDPIYEQVSALELQYAKTYGYDSYMDMQFAHQERFNEEFFKKYPNSPLPF